MGWSWSTYTISAACIKMLINARHTSTAIIKSASDICSHSLLLASTTAALLILNTCANFLKTLHHLRVRWEEGVRLVGPGVGTVPPILSFVSVCSAEQWEEKLTQAGQTLPGRDAVALGWIPASWTRDLRQKRKARITSRGVIEPSSKVSNVITAATS